VFMLWGSYAQKKGRVCRQRGSRGAPSGAQGPGATPPRYRHIRAFSAAGTSRKPMPFSKPMGKKPVDWGARAAGGSPRAALTSQPDPANPSSAAFDYIIVPPIPAASWRPGFQSPLKLARDLRGAPAENILLEPLPARRPCKLAGQSDSRRAPCPSRPRPRPRPARTRP